MERAIKLLKSETPPLLLVAASWLMALLYWPSLPDPMPTHWAISGKPDAFMPRQWGAFVGPLMVTGIYALLTALPYMDPRSRNWQSNLRFYPVLKNSLLVLLSFITYLALSTAQNPDQELRSDHLVVAMGLLFVVLGNYLPKVRSNFFLGIRTPWTLSNDEVWYRTHRLAGPMMVVAGLAIVAAAWLPPTWRFGVVIAAALLFSIVPVGYSWVLYRKLSA